MLLDYLFTVGMFCATQGTKCVMLKKDPVTVEIHICNTKVSKRAKAHLIIGDIDSKKLEKINVYYDCVGG